SAADVAGLGIRVGDPVTFIGELAEFAGGDRVCGKAMDDRMGVAILLQVLAELRGTTPHGTVQAVGTGLEEVGLRGAIMAAYRLEPPHPLPLHGPPAGGNPPPAPTPDPPRRQ